MSELKDVISQRQSHLWSKHNGEVTTLNSPPEQVAEQVPTGHPPLPFLYTLIHDFARIIQVQTLFACDGNLSPGLDDLVKEFLCLVAGHDSRALVVQQCGRRTLKYTNRGRVG